MIPADNNAPVSEEVRKLAEEWIDKYRIFHELWHDRRAFYVDELAQLLSDALRKERERVLEEVKRFAECGDTLWLLDYLAAKGASHE